MKYYKMQFRQMPTVESIQSNFISHSIKRELFLYIWSNVYKIAALSR